MKKQEKTTIPSVALRHFRKMRNRFPSVFPFSGKRRQKPRKRHENVFALSPSPCFSPFGSRLRSFPPCFLFFFLSFFAFGSPMPSSVSLRSTGSFLFFKTLLCFSFYFLFMLFLVRFPPQINKNSITAVVQCFRTSLFFLLFPPPFCFLPQFFISPRPLYFSSCFDLPSLRVKVRRDPAPAQYLSV